MPKCLSCGKSFEKILDGQILDGIEFQGQAFFGSLHDGYKFRLYICDDCVDKALKSDRIEGKENVF